VLPTALHLQAAWGVAQLMLVQQQQLAVVLGLVQVLLVACVQAVGFQRVATRRCLMSGCCGRVHGQTGVRWRPQVKWAALQVSAAGASVAAVAAKQ
jgi:hypothetical protein